MVCPRLPISSAKFTRQITNSRSRAPIWLYWYGYLRSCIVLRDLEQENAISQVETHDERDDQMVGNEDDFDGDMNTQIPDDENVDSLSKSSGSHIIRIMCPEGTEREMKGRPTVRDVYGLPSGEKVIVPYDQKYKAPYTKAQTLLSSFLYKLARVGTFAPLSILTWDNPMFDDFKKKMLQHVEFG